MLSIWFFCSAQISCTIRSRAKYKRTLHEFAQALTLTNPLFFSQGVLWTKAFIRLNFYNYF
jgi:hypothetical protein